MSIRLVLHRMIGSQPPHTLYSCNSTHVSECKTANRPLLRTGQGARSGSGWDWGGRWRLDPAALSSQAYRDDRAQTRYGGDDDQVSAGGSLLDSTRYGSTNNRCHGRPPPPNFVASRRPPQRLCRAHRLRPVSASAMTLRGPPFEPPQPRAHVPTRP